MTPGGPGLSASRFFNSLVDEDLRRFFDSGILGVLDAIFGGQVSGDDLRRVAGTLIDLDDILGQERGRRLVLKLLPRDKLAEFEARVGRQAIPEEARDWTDTQIVQARDFFGLVEERIHTPIAPAIATINPHYGLFGHQRTAVRKLLSLLQEDDRRALLHLPTGVGKTRTAMHIVTETLRKNEPSVVVWLASGKELLDQSVLGFQDAWAHMGNRPLQVGSMWGNRTPDLDSFSDGFLAVGLAKAWALSSQTDPGWAVRMSPRVRLVVFDEAHQSVARTYRQVTEELTLDYRCALLGLTATPGRTWADIDKDGELAEFYGGSKVGLEVPGPNPIEYLIEQGYLARPSFSTLFSEPGPSLREEELRDIAGFLDIPEAVISRLTMSAQYITGVLGAIEKLLGRGHLRILVFAATVDHARVLAAILVARDIRAGAITGTTPTRTREQVVRAFKADDGRAMVLVNYGVLTTGFDAPKASAIVIARPTHSLVLYSQMVGRGLRGPKAGGTDACEVVTVVDPRLPGFGDIAAAFLNWEDVWR